MLRSITATDIQTWLNGYEGKSDSLIIYILAALRGIYKGLA
jgi:hypothetical protein